MKSQCKTYWDGRFERTAVKLLPGDFYACSGDEVIVTVLGSCISVCLFDVEKKVGGMNHFMLPESKNCTANPHGYQNSSAARYGNAAMELLINEIIKLGGSRKSLTAKVFGGGSVTNSAIDIGEKNISFINEYLMLESIPVTNQDIGGISPRKIYFIPSINDVYVKTIKSIHNNTIERRETNYQKSIKTVEKNVFYL